MKRYVQDIADVAVEKEHFRRVLNTAKHHHFADAPPAPENPIRTE